MNFSGILQPVLTLSGLGLFFGVLLAFSSRIFHVDQDERLGQVIEALPGANCGGCGYPGCANLAQAILEGKAKPNACPVGGNKSAQAIAAILGVDAGEDLRFVAHVRCCGGDLAKNKYTYEGVADCRAAAALAGGPLGCTYGCFGLGTCVRECDYDALVIENGVAVVRPENCVACGRCIPACPRGLISMSSDKQDVFVNCLSRDTGAATRKVCEIGCIACMLCQKACPHDAITVTDNLAQIDESKCTNCGACVKVCPRKVIFDARIAPSRSLRKEA